MTLDLDAYLARLDYRGERAPTAAVLAAIVDHHMLAIPFENLDVLLGRGVRLDLPSLQAKLVDARRGGYCFEHATLVAAALEAIDFTVARHAARATMSASRSRRRRADGRQRLRAIAPRATTCSSPSRCRPGP